MAKHTIAQLRRALIEHDGMLTQAATALGVTRQGLHERVNRSAILQDAIREIEIGMLDTAEGNIAKGLRAGDKTLTTYYLDRKGQQRGYGNKVQVSVDDATLDRIVEIFDDPTKLRALRAAIAGPGHP